MCHYLQQSGSINVLLWRVIFVFHIRPIQERYDLEALKNKAQQYLTAVQWDPAGTGNNIDVFRAKVPLTNNKEELKWPCFKTRSIVNCSVSRLYNSLMDTENIMQYSE